MALQAIELDLEARSGCDLHEVVGGGLDTGNLIARMQDAFREQEARREFAVMARSPPGDRNVPAVQTDLQRLLDGD